MTRCSVPPDPQRSRRQSVPARPVVLADGQAWGLALPGLRYNPKLEQDANRIDGTAESLQIGVRVGYPWAIERLIDRLDSTARAPLGPTGDQERFDALMALASALLQRAHELEPAEVAALLTLDGSGSARLVDAVLDVAVIPACSFNLKGADA